MRLQCLCWLIDGRQEDNTNAVGMVMLNAVTEDFGGNLRGIPFPRIDSEALAIDGGHIAVGDRFVGKL